IFPAPPDDPYSNVDLDSPETFDWLENAIAAIPSAFVFIDTLTYATSRDLSEQKVIAALKVPLVRLVQKDPVNVFLFLHVSKEGHALGRRIKGITRTLIHLEAPDPSKTERLRLWVEKSYAKKPPALGVTITESGNKYDFEPPARAEQVRGGRPP